MRYRVGVDVGGTFTDFLLMDALGRTAVHKELSSPADPSEAVLRGLTELARGEASNLEAFLARVSIIVHGTTVTTNAVLTGTTARTGLITTRGFRDALQMRRGIREEMYDNRYHPPAPIVPRWLRLPVTERVAADGALVTPLDAAGVEHAAQRFLGEDIEAVAVCFLHAHANAKNERTSTTVLNAAVGPILARYLENLTAKLAAARYRGALLIMQSNGGVAAPAAVSRLAATTLLSGPAAAPSAGLACMAQYRDKSFVTMDMGGTSFDTALVRDGEPAVSASASVNRYALALPSMEINTVGAGGGSIAWIDQGGLLRMGPASAGADPGPACYARGGVEPTCTDANLVLGYLAAEYFAGGRMRLDTGAAQRAIAGRIAKPLGLSLEQAAHGMVQVINVNMAAAIREISVQKGYDPREFPLVCAGGAGPLHAAGIAAELGIARIVVPRDSSIFCAAGMLLTDLRHDYVRSCAQTLGGSAAGAGRVRRLVREMLAEARRALAREGIPPARQRMRFQLDLRYAGQYHEVTVEVSARSLDAADWTAVRERFHAQHDRLYGYALRTEGTAVELLNTRLSASGVTHKPALAREPRRAPGCARALKGKRPAYLSERKEYREISVFDADRLGHGNRLQGPAIIESANTSILVPTSWRAEYDGLGNCVLAAPAVRRGRSA
jgi:N-methylhydantoinase A